MTELKWLTGKDPKAMLQYVGPLNFKASDRQLRLCACRLFRLCEAEGYSFEKDNQDTIDEIEQNPDATPILKRDGWGWAGCLQRPQHGLDAILRVPTLFGGAGHVSFQAQADVLREIIGNPFRTPPPKQMIWTLPDPPIFDDGQEGWPWITPEVRAIARQAYDERDFALLGILADALEDAGCRWDALLEHLRGPGGPHCLGCWALDVVLGKE